MEDPPLSVISNLTGSRDTVQSSFLSSDLGFPSSILPNILNHFSDDESTGRSASAGCSDITSVFAFLAFLFALLDFLLNMMDGGRKKREVCSYRSSTKPQMQEGMLAVWDMTRGLLNIWDTEINVDCQGFGVCSAAQHAASRGRWGVVIGVVGSVQAGRWLERTGRWDKKSARVAGLFGAYGGDCKQRYPCHKLPQHYRSHLRGRDDVHQMAKNAKMSFKLFNNVLRNPGSKQAF